MNRRRAREIDLGGLAAHPDAHLDRRTVVQLLPGRVLPVRNPFQGSAHSVSRLRLERRHIVQYRIFPIGPGQRLQSPHPAVVGRQSRVQIGEIVLHAAGRILRLPQQLAHPLPVHLSPPRQIGRRDHHPLLFQIAGHRRHRPRPHAADLRVVRPAGHEPDPPAAFAEHRGDQRDVGQVRPAAGRMVGDHRVARFQRQFPADLAHAQPQRPQMHRNVRRVDHQFPLCVE